jgi:23S rRNA (guanosine2251-2'-O)-methyltransferase
MQAKKNIIVGRRPLIEAIAAGKTVERIYMQNDAAGDTIMEIRQAARKYNIPINMVPVEKLNSFSRTNHQGIVAFAASIQYFDLQQIISFVVEKGEMPLFVILDGITDVRNIGAIVRTAVCYGAQAIIIPDKGVAPLHEDAMKSSAGALEKIFVCRVNSLMKAVDELHLNDIKVYASEINASELLHELTLNEPCAIVMGSEGKGIYPALLKICDKKFKIPMKGNFDSLNVSVAAGIILYETMRQRGNRQ